MRPETSNRVAVEKILSTLDSAQRSFISWALLGNDIFLVGAAGAGKTRTIRALIDIFNILGVVVGITAATGIGVQALGRGGSTFHSFTGMRVPPKHFSSDEVVNSMLLRYAQADVIKNVDVVIIDEAWRLCRRDLDAFMKLSARIRGPDNPVHLILAGDGAQICSWEKTNTENNVPGPMSEYFKDMDVFELTKVYRQSDNIYQAALDAIRKGEPFKPGNPSFKFFTEVAGAGVRSSAVYPPDSRDGREYVIYPSVFTVLVAKNSDDWWLY